MTDTKRIKAGTKILNESFKMSIAQIVKILVDCFNGGGKILVMGNGGSSAESDHMASEFISHGFPAISLNNPATITAIANDHSYKEVFARQVWALGREGDILVGISTSGKSKNILEAYKIAKKLGVNIIDWPRKRIPQNARDVTRIQEEQLKLMHKVYLRLEEFYE